MGDSWIELRFLKVECEIVLGSGDSAPPMTCTLSLLLPPPWDTCGGSAGWGAIWDACYETIIRLYIQYSSVTDSTQRCLPVFPISPFFPSFPHSPAYLNRN
jgi:hypothetical protein